jgi:hypothetical protein
MFGLGVMLESKELSIGCIHKMLERLVTAIKLINSILRRSLILRRMVSKSNQFQLVCTIV